MPKREISCPASSFVFLASRLSFRRWPSCRIGTEESPPFMGNNSFSWCQIPVNLGVAEGTKDGGESSNPAAGGINMQRSKR